MNTTKTPDPDLLGILILQYYLAGSPKELFFEGDNEEDKETARKYKALDEAYGNEIKGYINSNFETRVAQDFWRVAFGDILEV